MMRTRARQLCTVLFACVLATAAYAPAVASAHTAGEGATAGQQELGGAARDEDELATGSASTVVTAVIEAPAQPKGTDKPSTAGVSAGAGSLIRTGDDTNLLGAALLALAAAVLVLASLLSRYTNSEKA